MARNDILRLLLAQGTALRGSLSSASAAAAESVPTPRGPRLERAFCLASVADAFGPETPSRAGQGYCVGCVGCRRLRASDSSGPLVQLQLGRRSTPESGPAARAGPWSSVGCVGGRRLQARGSSGPVGCVSGRHILTHNSNGSGRCLGRRPTPPGPLLELALGPASAASAADASGPAT